MNAQKPVSLNLNVRGFGLSATLEINERCRALRADGTTIHNFGLGQSPFPVPAPVVEALRRAAPEKDYLPVKGLPALRAAVAEFHRRHDGFDAQPEGVIIGPGSKELMFLLQLTFYGEIIIPTPCWVSYLPQARIIGRKVSMLHTTARRDWKLTAEQLLRAFQLVRDDFRPRLLVLNYPSNPTGLSYSAAELEDIAAVARRYEAIVLSDEIYGQLTHRGEHVSMARFYPDGTIVSSGLSKWCGAGGWRLGTCCFPPSLDWLLDAMASVASETYTSVCAPIQYAAVSAFRGGPEIELYLRHVRRILATLGRQCATILQGAGINVRVPDGGFYLWLDFSPLRERLARRGIEGGAELCDRLLEEAHVAILPGVAFARPRGELTARLAYVDFEGAQALRASEETSPDGDLPGDFARRWCERVPAGAEHIAQWARSLPS